MEENTSTRLKTLMAERQLKQVDILRLSQPYCKMYDVKLNKSDLSQFVSGKVSPGQWKLTILSLALNVSEAWLMGLDVPRERERPSPAQPSEVINIENIIPVPKMSKIPLVGTIACGAPILAEQNIDGEVSLPEHIHADFALRCKGDSMINARIFDGDIVYIRKQDTVDSGEIAAVYINDEATLKRVRLFDDHIVLEPSNPMYEPFVYWREEMNNVHILGKAVAFTSEVR